MVLDTKSKSVVQAALDKLGTGKKNNLTGVRREIY